MSIEGRPSALLAPVLAGGDRIAVRFPGAALSYTQLRDAALRAAAGIGEARRVAVLAEAKPETVVAIVGALIAGVPLVPVNPKAGGRELEHELVDSAPEVILCAPDAQLPAGIQAIRRQDVDLVAQDAAPAMALDEPSPEAPAIILYTSGTTGPPKGVVLPRRAIAANLDALAGAWEWTADDVLVHGLPLFHAHGLVLGVLGPLRRGGELTHVGRFTTEAIAAELRARATILFGVPTMYHRLAQDAEDDSAVARALAGARLLISGSAPLSRADFDAIARSTGQRVLERYGMSETLFICAARAGVAPVRGSVGPPVPGVEFRRVDEDGVPLHPADRQTPGEVQVRGANLFLGYLNRPDATEAAFAEDGWFATGDIATQTETGEIILMGRASIDIIKSGGYKIGAGEIETVLLEHEHVVEAAVTGEPDDDLGQRVVAWVVPREPAPLEQTLIDHVASSLAPHKRPRTVHYLKELPRNHMGKVLKRELSPLDAEG